MGQGARLPEMGEKVGKYRIVEVLGEGGQGLVYKAERAGCFYAVKLLHDQVLEHWFRRELSILGHLRHPNVVRFFGCDYWPDPSTGQPFLVMELIEGRTLESFAREENPSARRLVHIVLEVARTLGEVFRQGVLHRDLKPGNILIRDADESPVLIDFGVGSLMGAPTGSGVGLPPGTPEYRSPEAYRFLREPANEGRRYEHTLADELWALGVSLYWLLTDCLPFGERQEEEGGGLAARILHQVPRAPHVLNPRVPRELSGVCLRMLEKEPGARLASMEALCEALEAALAGAGQEEGWDGPLCEPDAPDNRMTEEDPARADPEDPLRWLRRWAVEKPRRGRRPVERAPARSRPHIMMRALLGLVCVALLGEACPIPPVGFVREVAGPGKPLESGGGAALLLGAATPAPVAMAMPSKDETSLKKEEKRAPKKQKQGQRSQWKEKCVGVACCVALAGCAGAQVRPPSPAPQPEACPPQAVETMKKLGVELEEKVPASFTREPKLVTLREGPASVTLGMHLGELEAGTVLHGRLLFGANRVYGRFTEARTPDQRTFPVCMELAPRVAEERGVEVDEEGGPDTAILYTSQSVRPVRSFD